MDFIRMIVLAGLILFRSDGADAVTNSLVLKIFDHSVLNAYILTIENVVELLA